MALYIPHSIFHLARLLYVRPESFGPYYVLCGYLGTLQRRLKMQLLKHSVIKIYRYVLIQAPDNEDIGVCAYLSTTPQKPMTTWLLRHITKTYEYVLI